MARRTLKQAEAEIVVLKGQIARLVEQREALKEFFGELLGDVFVGEDAAAEIARDAVSERIW